MTMARRRAVSPRCRDERGQTTVLIVGFAIVAMMLVAVVVDASAAYLRRSGLDSLADGAALAAADGIQGEQVYEGGLGERAQIDPALAHQYVSAYLNAVAAARRYPGMTYRVEVGAERVVVHIESPLDLPITPPGSTRQTTISATAASIVLVSQ